MAAKVQHIALWRESINTKTICYCAACRSPSDVLVNALVIT